MTRRPPGGREDSVNNRATEGRPTASRLRKVFLEWLEEARSGRAPAFIEAEDSTSASIEELLGWIEGDMEKLPADYCVSFGLQIGTTFGEAAEKTRTWLRR